MCSSAETNTIFVYSNIHMSNERIVGGDMYFQHNDGMCTT